MVQSRTFRNVPAGLADDQDQFALVIELRRGTRPDQRHPVADKGTWRAHEHAGIFRGVLAILVFGVAVRVIHADADDLFRRRDRRQPGDRIERMIRLMARGFFRELCQGARRDGFAQGWIILGEAGGEIDDAAVDDRAVSARAVDGLGGEAGSGHRVSGLSLQW